MLTLSVFERLVLNPPAPKALPDNPIRQDEDAFHAFWRTLDALDGSGRYQHLKKQLTELIVVEMDDKTRLVWLDRFLNLVLEVMGQMQGIYLHAEMSLTPEETKAADQARALCFLMLVGYSGVAARAKGVLGIQKSAKDPRVIDTLIHGIYRIHQLYLRIMLEYALIYQKTPSIVWRCQNHWYLSALEHKIEHKACAIGGDAGKSIHHLFVQAALGSFSNFFAYRRTDIISMFRLLPIWSNYIDASLIAHKGVRLFINLKESNAPETLSPDASINPFEAGKVCLFFDPHNLIKYLSQSHFETLTQKRLADMALLAYKRTQKTASIPAERPVPALMYYGFENVLLGVGGATFASLINQKRLAPEYHPLHTPLARQKAAKTVRITQNFVDHTRFDDSLAPFEHALVALGLFALKSETDQTTRPWRLGLVEWIDPTKQGGHTEVEGRYLGRIVTMAGVRLYRKSDDGRGVHFVPAIMTAGDSSTQSATTLVMGRAHFVEGDRVVLRIGGQDSNLILTKQILSTDDILSFELGRLPS